MKEEELRKIEEEEEEEFCSYCLTPITDWDDVLTDREGSFYCTIECAMDDHGIVSLQN